MLIVRIGAGPVGRVLVQPVVGSVLLNAAEKEQNGLAPPQKEPPWDGGHWGGAYKSMKVLVFFGFDCSVYLIAFTMLVKLRTFQNSVLLISLAMSDFLNDLPRSAPLPSKSPLITSGSRTTAGAGVPLPQAQRRSTGALESPA